MKIRSNTNDIQKVRNNLDNSIIKIHLEEVYSDSNIFVWNFWFIIVPNSKCKPVRKIYTHKKYYQNETEGYTQLTQTKLQIPDLLWSWTTVILWQKYDYIDICNIRKNRSKYLEIIQISPQQIGTILSEFHTLSYNNWRACVHWNLHQSNFFLADNGDVGIFDFVSMHENDVEYDFATLYYNSEYNDVFLWEILENYIFQENVSYKKILIYTILRVSENIKWNIYLNDDDRRELKWDLARIKNKLWNIT